MNSVRVISVNPSEKTLGEKLFNQNRLSTISRCLAKPGRKLGFSWAKFANFLFGINRNVNSQLSGKLFLLRLLCGAAVLASVLVPMHPDAVMAFDFELMKVPALLFGTMLVTGLFLRPASVVAAGWFGFIAYRSVMAGAFDLEAASMTLVALIFTVLGPGRYAIDQIFRHAVFALGRINRRKRSRKAGRGLDYRAYVSVDRRVV